MELRVKLANDLITRCSQDSYPDLAKIAEALKRGDSMEDILFMPELFRWPDAYKWLKARL